MSACGAGDGARIGTVVIVALAVTGLLDVVTRRRTSALWFVAVVGVGEHLVANGIKLAVRRARPDVLDTWLPRAAPSRPGTRAAAAACWAAVAIVVAARWSRSRFAVAGAVHGRGRRRRRR